MGINQGLHRAVSIFKTLWLFFLVISVCSIMTTSVQAIRLQRDGSVKSSTATSQTNTKTITPSQNVSTTLCDLNTSKHDCRHTNKNSSDSISGDNILGSTDALRRMSYVILGFTGIVVVYFVVRAVLLRRKRTKTRKYGIIAKQGDRGDMEMEPLGDGNEDDDDYTVFELNGRKK